LLICKTSRTAPTQWQTGQNRHLFATGFWTNRIVSELPLICPSMADEEQHTHLFDLGDKSRGAIELT
jgi:hypothetical protein